MQVPLVALVPWEKYIFPPHSFFQRYSVFPVVCVSCRKIMSALVWINHWNSLSLFALFEGLHTFWDLINIVPELALIIYVLFPCWADYFCMHYLVHCYVAHFMINKEHTIGTLCGYAIRSGRHPEGSQRPLGRSPPGRWLLDAWPYRVTTKYSFYPVCIFKMLNKKIIDLTVLWNEKYSDLMGNYLSILIWRRLPIELTWSPRAECPTLCSMSQRTAPGP